MENEAKTHVLIVPYPGQGHINPMHQFAKRIVNKGVKATLVVTKFISKSMHAETGKIGVEMISDGYDDGGFTAAESVEAYLSRFATVGSETLTEVIKKQESSGYPVSCVIYDSFIPWALDVAHGFGIQAGTFFTQSCAVNNIYYQFHEGLLDTPESYPAADPTLPISIPGLPPLRPKDLPSFFYVPGYYGAYFEMLMNQYSNLKEANWIFVNTYKELEVEVVEYMAKDSPLRTIGPTLPSMYLDKRIPDDTDYKLNIYKPDSSLCMNWLNEKPNNSVVFVSFGSLAELGVEQMEELAYGLKHSDCYFLWVVRATTEEKLPSKFKEEVSEKALSLGVPMVAMPQWTDQTTNAKFVQDIWGTGVRVSVDENGIVKREEIEYCIKQVLEGVRSVEIRKNAIKWRNLAKEALGEGGSSEKNFDEFISKLTPTPELVI
ncbi:hypothetical protein IFM89_008098 [Coptis chinensis]|uniref:Uncharacterized protein n=1 Tax=Coptis chinensis TaxID=261450 RepID=A0A835M9D5_9MAGN|nr:hypothetical protein IFM89_008098 [Coptis chinensis]